MVTKYAWNYDFLYQILGILLFVIIAFIIYELVNRIVNDSTYILIRLFISALIYFSIVIFFKKPWFLGLTHSELYSYISN